MKFEQFLLTALCVICASCSSEDNEIFEFESEFNSDYTSRSINSSEEEKHPLIAGHYVDFIDNQYIINISKEEAVERGISEKSYDDFLNSVTIGNRLLASIIDSCKSVGKDVMVSTCIYDEYQNDTETISISRLKTRSESLPSGRITTTGQETGKYGFFVPINMKSVDFDCYSYTSPLAMQVVIAESWNIQDIKSSIGQHVTMNATFSVTNVPGGVQYKTSDSNGGTCAWRGSLK